MDGMEIIEVVDVVVIQYKMVLLLISGAIISACIAVLFQKCEIADRRFMERFQLTMCLISMVCTISAVVYGYITHKTVKQYTVNVNEESLDYAKLIEKYEILDIKGTLMTLRERVDKEVYI